MSPGTEPVIPVGAALGAVDDVQLRAVLTTIAMAGNSANLIESSLTGVPAARRDNTSMPLAVGAEVIVATLGKKRGVVVEAGRGGHYRVRVDNLTVSCREDELSVAPPADRKRRGRRSREGPREEHPAVPRAAERIDLHGLTVEAAIARVVDAIDHALRDDADRLEIVHGKGSGRIREAVHRHLATLPVVNSFELDPRNAGVTVVRF